MVETVMGWLGGIEDVGGDGDGEREGFLIRR